MIKLESKDNYIYVNRLNGNFGNTIIMPDTADPYVWVECTLESYKKWRDTNNQQKIDEQIVNVITQTPQVIDSTGKIIPINITELNVNFDDAIYTFAQLMKDNGAAIYNNVDLLNKEYLTKRINK